MNAVTTSKVRSRTENPLWFGPWSLLKLNSNKNIIFLLKGGGQGLACLGFFSPPLLQVPSVALVVNSSCHCGWHCPVRAGESASLGEGDHRERLGREVPGSQLLLSGHPPQSLASCRNSPSPPAAACLPTTASLALCIFSILLLFSVSCWSPVLSLAPPLAGASLPSCAFFLLLMVTSALVSTAVSDHKWVKVQRHW